MASPASARLAVSPHLWTSDEFPDLGEDHYLGTCLAGAREAGFAGIELGTKFPRQPELLQPILEMQDLALATGFHATSLTRHDGAAEAAAAAPLAALLKAMGCTVMLAGERANAIVAKPRAPLSSRPILASEEFARFAERFRDFAAAMRHDHGLTVALRHQMGTVVQTEAEIDRFMELTKGTVALALDTAHAAFAGADSARLARHYNAQIAHLVCQDVREKALWAANRADASYREAVLGGVFGPAGEGLVDFNAVLAALPAFGGWVTIGVEQNPDVSDPVSAAQAGLAAILQLIGKAITR